MKEPLGLPRGSVRGVIALAFSGTACYLWATGVAVPGELLTTLGTVIAFYYVERSKQNEAAPAQEPLAAPAIGPDDED